MSALAFNNPRVQQLRRLIGRRSSRHAEGLFVVEGPVLVAEAVAAGWTVAAQFVAAEDDGVVEPGVAGAGPVFELAPGVLDRVASTATPQNPIALVEMPARAATDRASAGQASAGQQDQRDVGRATSLLASGHFVVVLDRVADPGNLGTILRSAEAAGIDLVVLTPGSVDPYNPKAIRASAGALFHVPVIEATLDQVLGAGLITVGTSSRETPHRTVVEYTETDLCGRVALVMGNEAAGLPDEWTDDSGPISRWTTIPHAGRSESLNVAMAATVLVFEAARQRGDRQSSSTSNDDG